MSKMEVQLGTNEYESVYRFMIDYVLTHGVWVYNERTKTRCLTVPTYVVEYDLHEHGAPLLNGRPSYPVSAIAEIVGYNRCLTNAQDFADIGSPTWFVNANETEAWVNNPHRKGENDLGLVYGAALGSENIREVWDNISNAFDNRGLILNWWQPHAFNKAALRPCMHQHVFSIVGDKLSLTSSQRSMDLMCGGNFNSIQVYFTGMLAAKMSGCVGGSAVHVIDNLHIYEDHIKGVEEYMSRDYEPVPHHFKINDWVKGTSDLVDSTCHARDYFTLTGYKGNPQEKINFKLIA